MLKLSGRKVLKGIHGAITGVLFHELTFLLGIFALIIGGICYWGWYETVKKPRMEKEAQEQRSREADAQIRAEAERTVDDFVAAYTDWCMLPPNVRKDAPEPKIPDWNRRAHEVLERRLAEAKKPLPSLETEPTAGRQEYARRLVAHVRKFAWMQVSGLTAEGYLRLVYDRKEARWLSEMEDRYNAETFRDVDWKIRSSEEQETEKGNEMLSARLTGCVGYTQIVYACSGDFTAHHDAIRDVISAGSVEKTYANGIWLGEEKKTGIWSAAYDLDKSPYDRSPGSRILDLGKRHVVALRLYPGKLVMVFHTNELIQDHEQRKIDEAAVRLAQTAGLDVSGVEKTRLVGAYAYEVIFK